MDRLVRRPALIPRGEPAAAWPGVRLLDRAKCTALRAEGHSAGSVSVDGGQCTPGGASLRRDRGGQCQTASTGTNSGRECREWRTASAGLSD
jgi:hypothetical protein